MQSTVWGRVSTQNSLTYAFDNNSSSRLPQDVGLDGLINEDEFGFSTYSDYLAELRRKLSPSAIERMEADPFSPFNDPAGDNYHFSVDTTTMNSASEYSNVTNAITE